MPEAKIKAVALDQELARIDRARRRAERVWAKEGQTREARRDLERIYGGLFIGGVVAFERFLEELFVGLLVDRKDIGLVSSRREVDPYVQLRSHDGVRRILFDGPKGYVEWLPFDRTEERAKRYFREGAPFTKSLESGEKAQLRRVLALRNALAHQSRKSLSGFERVTLANVMLAPRDREPNRYLRSQLAVNPARTRFEGHFAELSGMGWELSK